MPACCEAATPPPPTAVSTYPRCASASLPLDSISSLYPQSRYPSALFQAKRACQSVAGLILATCGKRSDPTCLLLSRRSVYHAPLLPLPHKPSPLHLRSCTTAARQPYNSFANQSAAQPGFLFCTGFPATQHSNVNDQFSSVVLSF